MISQGLTETFSAWLNVVMDVNMNALNKACAAVGCQDRLAELLLIRSASISGWRKRGQVPAERCLAIEQATAGAVTRHDLRPDVFGVASTDLQEAG